MTENEEVLFHKFLNRTLSEEEWKTLLDYLEKPENKEVFNSYVKTDFLLNMSYQEEGVPLSYDTLSRSINNNADQKLTKPWPKQYWWAVAASLILLIGLALGAYHKSTPLIKETPVVVKTSVEQGTNGAILTLEDGTEVALEEDCSYENSYVTSSSNGEELVYAKNPIGDGNLYNTIAVARGKQFALTLSDGTRVWLNSDSKLKYPVSFDAGKTRTVELLYGEAYFDVSPAAHNQGSAFEVRQDHQKVTVLGTEFNIKAYAEEKQVLTTLVEGKVEVTARNESMLLVPNKQAVNDVESGKMAIHQVDAQAETAWRHGLFMFKNKNLGQIAVTLSRWYDIDIDITDNSMETIEFKGALSKNQPLEEILELIKNTKFINNYGIAEDKVVIW
jgi:ferric-dicitrate binding protein FerR (iron transport regulator)